jgi:hypothetical protein
MDLAELVNPKVSFSKTTLEDIEIAYEKTVFFSRGDLITRHDTEPVAFE